MPVQFFTDWGTDLDALRTHINAWDRLARCALEPNVFYESWALLPALGGLADASVGVLLVWSDSDNAELIGLFPLEQRTRYRKVPARHWLMWTHLHCFLGLPLVHRDYVQPCLEQFLAWLDQHPRASVFSFSKLPTDGLFYRQLHDYLQQKNRLSDTLDAYERALLCSSLSAQDYVETHIRKKKIKEYKRLERRLGEIGELETTLFNAAHRDSQLDAWIDDFLQLEQSGWKGRESTAMACTPVEANYARALIRGAAERGQLVLLRTTLDNKPIAMKVSFAAASQGAKKGSFAFKIAHDEDYGAYSPGVLLELENMRQVLDGPGLAWMDSCADPEHPMIDHLWHERRAICNLRISTARAVSKPLLRVLSYAKSVYLRYRKKKAVDRGSIDD